ncbi:protein CcmA, bactofilin family [Limimonas halophila]|uniref:Protein CcmA, bactofilin family n=1 Tax=Limimonas halophila TaxID=1082479 RepID=A0A1G7S5U0_9PROT|nr:polymer-forming cytoskeletal protein [Limimonas halophila]SDG17550.1 protein CcmA, bactofilin family [Limimonas halophila]
MFGKRTKQQPKQDTRREPSAAPASPAGEGDGDAPGESKPGGSAQASAPVQPERPTRPDPSAVLNRQPTPPVNPEPSRQASNNRQRGKTAPAQDEDAGNKLIVGQNIRMSGEIAACDKLLVEGMVEADLTETRELEVAPTGSFKGSAVIDVAEIAGRFEGDLVVRERLNLRANGQVHGTIRYRALEIESGGRIGGTLVELSAEEAERYRTDDTAAQPANGAADPAAEPARDAAGDALDTPDDPLAAAGVGDEAVRQQDG